MGNVKEIVAKHIRLAFDLMKEKGNYKFGEINLSDDRVALCAGIYSDLSDEIEICGIKVLLCNLQSSYDYFLCINNPNKSEIEFLKCHIEAMQLSY